VNQITWQVGTLGEVGRAIRWFGELGIPIQRSGRDFPGSNWHTYIYDPDGHTNELYYGIEQIGWQGYSKPRAMYDRGFREAPTLPQINEFQEVQDAMAKGISVTSGYRHVDELPVREGRLDRVEVLPLEVLDERELELLVVRELAHDRGDPIQAGRDGCPKAAFTRDQLVAVEDLRHEDRLDDAVLGDARRERGQGRLVHVVARLVRVRSDPVGGDLGRRRLARVALRDERGKPATEALRTLRADGHATTAGSRVTDGGSPRVPASASGAMTGTAGRLARAALRARNSSAAWRYATAPGESGR